jgi:RNA-dependent RNA polymerase
MNLAALDQITKALGFSHRPAAVQGRIGLGKGIWVLSLDEAFNSCPEPRIRINDSQNKIFIPHYAGNNPEARSHRIFNLLRPSTCASPAQLNRQAIPCLWNGGVPAEYFVNLMQAEIRSTLDRFTSWEGPYSMTLLAKAVESTGGLLGSYARQLSAGQARARGHGAGITHDEDKEEAPIPADTIVVKRNMAGAPEDLYRSTIELIHAGFSPATCGPLFMKVRSVIDKALERQLLEYHIPLTGSAEAIGVPGNASVCA